MAARKSTKSNTSASKSDLSTKARAHGVKAGQAARTGAIVTKSAFQGFMDGLLGRA